MGFQAQPDQPPAQDLALGGQEQGPPQTGPPRYTSPPARKAPSAPTGFATSAQDSKDTSIGQTHQTVRASFRKTLTVSKARNI